VIGQFGRRAAATLAACARPARLETSPGRKAQSAALLGLGLLSCTRASKQVIDAQLTGAAAPSVAAASSGASPPSPSAAASASSAVVVAESIYDGGLRNGWQDWGWAPREVDRGGPARVPFA